MFSKVAVLFVASMAVFVAAAPTPDGIENSCNSGPVQCCNSLMDSKSSQANILLTLLGIAAGPITGQVGANCSPITAIGLGSNSCSSQPVCCSDNHFNGLIAVGCSPLNVNA